MAETFSILESGRLSMQHNLALKYQNLSQNYTQPDKRCLLIFFLFLEGMKFVKLCNLCKVLRGRVLIPRCLVDRHHLKLIMVSPTNVL